MSVAVPFPRSNPTGTTGWTTNQFLIRRSTWNSDHPPGVTMFTDLGYQLEQIAVTATPVAFSNPPSHFVRRRGSGPSGHRSPTTSVPDQRPRSRREHGPWRLLPVAVASGPMPLTRGHRHDGGGVRHGRGTPHHAGSPRPPQLRTEQRGRRRRQMASRHPGFGLRDDGQRSDDSSGWSLRDLSGHEGRRRDTCRGPGKASPRPIRCWYPTFQAPGGLSRCMATWLYIVVDLWTRQPSASQWSMDTCVWTAAVTISPAHSIWSEWMIPRCWPPRGPGMPPGGGVGRLQKLVDDLPFGIDNEWAADRLEEAIIDVQEAIRDLRTDPPPTEHYERNVE
ncbi:MAG: hypothetical protein Ct9H300mP12_08840 [Acidimicrobiales bacterium]|nr:MAG: hypothetical protein Ct9H300mP12_08840 [Acidimicrobiales bacterium]